MKIVTPEQMKKIELRCEELGVSREELMQNAGTAIADVADEYLVLKYDEDHIGKSVVFLAGSGNNGGDCFVAARQLAELDYDVTVVNLCGQPHTELAQNAFRKLLGTRVHIIRAYRGQNMKTAIEAAELEFMTNPEESQLERIRSDEKQRIDSVMEALENADIIVDGVFGTGFHGKLDSEISDFLNAETKAYRISVDVPSGGNSATGEADEYTFSADETIALGTVKTGMTQYPLIEKCGNVITADIGILDEAYDVIADEKDYTLIDENELVDFPKSRNPVSHKGTYGKVLCITGSSKMRGASALSALSALRSGAGLVTVASVEKAVDTAALIVPEATFCPLECDDSGFMLYQENEQRLKDEMEKADAVLIGCGMGVTHETEELTKFVIQNANCPIIIDADGINCVSSDIDILLKKKTDVVITPHPGEMARLLGCTAADINKDRFSAAGEFAKMYGVTVVLKGAGTVISSPKSASVIDTGNPGMSCGGSGDVLAGIIASFAAQGYSAFDASRIAAYIHGLAGDIAAKDLGQEYMLPRDIIGALSDSFEILKAN